MEGHLRDSRRAGEPRRAYRTQPRDCRSVGCIRVGPRDAKRFDSAGSTACASAASAVTPRRRVRDGTRRRVARQLVLALHDRLDRAVAAIADPARHAERLARPRSSHSDSRRPARGRESTRRRAIMSVRRVRRRAYRSSAATVLASVISPRSSAASIASARDRDDLQEFAGIGPRAHERQSFRDEEFDRFVGISDDRNARGRAASSSRRRSPPPRRARAARWRARSRRGRSCRRETRGTPRRPDSGIGARRRVCRRQHRHDQRRARMHDELARARGCRRAGAPCRGARAAARRRTRASEATCVSVR